MTLSNPILDYWIDAAQRNVLFWDLMRQRGNQYIEHAAESTPHVLQFDYDLVMNGADLPRPVNYGLVRIRPPEGVKIDETKQPYIVIDPRAGHGPGIGGFKADSEIGFAMRAGHPCYFAGFLPEPLPGQTIEDVMLAEVAFAEYVIAQHPKASGKPVLIGNCQAGWAVMMLAAYRPDLMSAVIVAGGPLTYWAGKHGENPMRYSGGWLGGTWMTRLTSDLGDGTFDGAWLVSNFEGMNPSHALWSKQYDVYKSVDTEGPRYLGFEKWWGGHVILNGEEMQFIVDNLFVGNTLPTGGVTTTDGVRLDYRNITAPIVCFCSMEDNITPPQQALGWILDLYDDVSEIRAHGQTIVYAIHETTGHLGIFVSGKVARKEQREFISNMDFIDILPPGLYEAVLSDKTAETEDAELSPTDYITGFEPRTLDDIRALGANTLEDERSFAAVQRMSEINNSLYTTYAQPFVQAMSGPLKAELFQEMHPARMGYKMWSDLNPFMGLVEVAAENVRKHRRPVDTDNPIWKAQEQASDQIVTALDLHRDVRDAMVEKGFEATFGNPVVQAALGVSAEDGPPRPKPGLSADQVRQMEKNREEILAAVHQGGMKEACVRALLYIAMPRGSADERRFEMLERLHPGKGETLSEFKSTVREQFYVLLLDEEGAIEALPEMLSANRATIDRAFEDIRAVMTTGGAPEGEAAERFRQIEIIFNSAPGTDAKPAKRARKRKS